MWKIFVLIAGLVAVAFFGCILYLLVCALSWQGVLFAGGCGLLSGIIAWNYGAGDPDSGKRWVERYERRLKKEELERNKKKKGKQRNVSQTRKENDAGLSRQSQNVNMGAATVLAGAALYHQYKKHHRQDDTSVTPDDRYELLDDEFDELDDYHDDINDMYDPYIDDVSNNNDFSSISYNDYSSYSDDIAAYDDFMSSSDMD